MNLIRISGELLSAVVVELLCLLGSVLIFFLVGKLHKRGGNGSNGNRTPGSPEKIICKHNYLTQVLCFHSGNLSLLVCCSLWLHPFAQINRAERFKLILTFSFLPCILKFSIILFYFSVHWWAVTGLFLNKASIGAGEKCDLLGALKKSQDFLRKKNVRQAIIKQALADMVILVCAKLRNTLVLLCRL